MFSFRFSLIASSFLGPITSKPTATFGKVKFLYQSNHADAKDDAALAEKAKAAVGEVFVE